MDKIKLSTANIVILVSGVVILIASFLPFIKWPSPYSHSYSAWSKGGFLIATIPALLGVAMAVQVGIQGFASGVKMPEKVLGFSWTQIHLVFAFQATIMMIAFLIRDTGGLDRGIGLYLMLLAAIGLLVGAILRLQEKPAGAAPPSAPPAT
jgi:hypothetical protein